MTEEVSAKQASLVAKLYTLTKNKKLRWEVEEWNERLQTSLSGMEIVLKSIEYESTPYEVIEIYKGESLVQSFNDGNLQGIPQVGAFDSHWEIMVQLHEMAKRQASGVEEDLDALLSSLDELDDDVPF